MKSNSKRFSILLIGTQMAFGGAQRLLLDQAEWFTEQGYEVFTVFFYDRDGLHDKWQKIYNFPILNLRAYKQNQNYLKTTINLITGIWRLWQLFRVEKIDSVIAFTHDSNILALTLAWFAGVPVRIGTHLGVSQGMPILRQKLHTALVNMGIIQTLIAASTRTKTSALVEGVRADKVEVIFNGIRPFSLNLKNRSKIREKLGLRGDTIFLLSVGRLVYEKGHDILIQSLYPVVHLFPTVILGICGSGPLLSELQKKISDHKLENNVKLLGQWDDVFELLTAADVFVLPSRSEGLPMALLEAMMAGLPIIATHVEGVDDVIIDGVHGLLVSIENPTELSKAILQLLSNLDNSSRMGREASFRVLQLYTTDTMCKKYLQVIDRFAL